MIEFLPLHPKVTLLIYQKVDVFCPCALNHSINKKTLNDLQCRAIVGSANNQMENQRVENAVFSKGILYGVDYAVNAGGLVSVVDQYQNGGTHDHARIMAKLAPIQTKIEHVFAACASTGLSPAIVSDRMVEAVLT